MLDVKGSTRYSKSLNRDFYYGGLPLNVDYRPGPLESSHFPMSFAPEPHRLNRVQFSVDKLRTLSSRVPIRGGKPRYSLHADEALAPIVWTIGSGLDHSR